MEGDCGGVLDRRRFEACRCLIVGLSLASTEPFPHRHPICSGAESFLAGTASCRIQVSDVDALFAELQSAGVLHDVSRAGVTATDFGTREFSTLDSDGNLLTFFRWNDG
jgi:hypothetical protein